MEAKKIEADETIPASRKLGSEQAAELVAAAKRVVVAKGKRLCDFDTAAEEQETIVKAMLGPTGNLRAPTLVVGDTVLVGFNDERYDEVLG